MMALRSTRCLLIRRPCSSTSLLTQFVTLRCRAFSTNTSLLKGEDPSFSNIPIPVRDKVGAKLLHRKNHPLNILKKSLLDYFTCLPENETLVAAKSIRPGVKQAGSFHVYDDLYPLTSTEDSFDHLLVPPDHVSREKGNTYYAAKKTVLRPHTTAHSPGLLREGVAAAIVTGDVYRRDEIDRSHYPVFHQMDGYRVFHHTGIERGKAISILEDDMKRTLEGMAKHLFGPATKTRWVSEFFPFTHPSHELEVFFEGDWMEVLGCGIFQPSLLENTKFTDCSAWAFGLGLERLAMILFDIPDIRLFWSEDRRFHQQFDEGRVVKFVPFSKYPPIERDVAFWIPTDYEANRFFEIVREIAGELVEEVKTVDQFEHPKTRRKSVCYRIIYRSMERSLTSNEVNEIQSEVRRQVELLGGELR